MRNIFSHTSKAGSPALLRLLPYLSRYQFQTFLLLGVTILAALATLALPLAIRRLIDSMLQQTGKINGNENVMADMQAHFWGMWVVVVLIAAFSAARLLLASSLGERVTVDIKNTTYRQVMQLRPAFFETMPKNEVLSCITVDAGILKTIVGTSIPNALRNFCLVAGATLMLVLSNPWLTMHVLLLLFLIVLPLIYLGRRVRKLSRLSQRKNSASNAIAAEAIQAIAVVQSNNAEHFETKRFAAANENATVANVKRDQWRALMTAFLIITTGIGLLWGLHLGTQAIIERTMTFGQLGQTGIYILVMARALAASGEIYGDLEKGAGATDRLFELLERDAGCEPTKPTHSFATSKHTAAIEFAAVDFEYPTRLGQPALKQLNMAVQTGQTVALVGTSGAGKSTVFQLLLRFYEPTSGHIYINGAPIRDLDLHDLRRQIGLVPQEAVIFSSNAFENIRYGKPEATDAEVIQAAKAAFADEFIRLLPSGYDTFLGEQGIRLSVGQRQRISIARALLKNPAILLLDEATSALDAHSEHWVQAALENAKSGRTTLVIAHRLATVQKADKIMVLDHGKIIETGTHTDLMKQGGKYAQLAALQFAA